MSKWLSVLVGLLLGAGAVFALYFYNDLYKDRPHGPTGPPAFRWSSDNAPSGDYHDLPVYRVIDGIAESSQTSVPTIDGEDAYISMNLEIADAMSSTHELVVEDFGGLRVWSDRIPYDQVADGRCYLRVDGLTPGRYRIKLFQMESDGFTDIVAESAFRVLE